MPSSLDIVNDFSGGVNLRTLRTKLPDNMYPDSINGTLIPVTGGGTGITKRPGYRYIGATYYSESDYVVGISSFYHITSAGTRTRSTITLTNEGRVYALNLPSSTLINLPTANGEFAQNYIAENPDNARFAHANNMLFCVTGKDEHFKLYRKTGDSTIYAGAIGVKAPTSAPTLTNAGVGNMTGYYEIVATFYNSSTGGESARSATASIGALTSAQIGVNATSIGTYYQDSDKVNIYIRKPSIGTTFVRAAQINVGTSTTLNLSDQQINNLIIQAPKPNANQVLLPGMVDICWHLSRMFATNGEYVYYSEVGLPESYSAYNYLAIFPNDGQRIVGLHSVNETTLLILKERSCYLLQGDSPATWEINLLTQSTGCNSVRSICEGNGLITWWSEDGPVIWDKQSEPSLIGDYNTKQLEEDGVLSIGRDKVFSAFDAANSRFIYRVYTTDSDYLKDGKIVIAYSLIHRAWESTFWDIGKGGVTSHAAYDVSALASLPCSTTGINTVVFAKQLGVLYEFDNKCFTDGAANETGADLFFEITGADSDSVTFTFSGTVPVSPRETSCTVINKDTLAIHRSQYSISGTTTKTATLLTPFSSIPPVGSVITFDLPVLQWDSRVFNGNAPFDQKRYLFTHARIAANGDNKSFVGVKINNSTTCAKAWHLNFSGLGHFDPNQTPPSVAGAEYGFKGRVAKVGEEAQLRFIGYYPRCEWFLSTLALRYTNHYARI